jgi:hypothetical protein
LRGKGMGPFGAQKKIRIILEIFKIVVPIS